MEIEQYSGKTVPECKSVGITLSYPVFSDLTADQLDYYLYWRNTIGEEGFRKAPKGYVWLLICEIINDRDKDNASRRLNALSISAANDSSPLYPELLGIAVEFALVNGTPLPEYSPWMQTSDILFQWVMSSPPSDPSPSVLGRFYPALQRDSKASRALGTALRRYDSLLNTEGTSVSNLLFRTERTSCIPFRDYVDLGPRVPYEITSHVPDENMVDRFMTFITEIYMSGSSSVDGFPHCRELAEYISDAVKTGNFDESPDPFSKTGTVTYRRFGTTPGPEGPSCLCDPEVPDHSQYRITLGDVLTFAGKEGIIPVPFVASDLEHPSYSDLSKDQFAYFIYWRSSFRKGRALDTDTGYINLFLTEIINTCGAEESVALVGKLISAYGMIGLLPVTLLDIHILNGLPFTDHNQYTDRYVVNLWIEAFTEKKNETPLDMTLLNIMRSGSLNVRFSGNPVPMEPFVKAAGRIFSELRSRKPLADVFGAERVTARRSIFVGLDYLRGPKEKTVTFTNYLGCRKFITFMDKVVRYAGSITEGYTRNGGIRKVPFSFSGVNCAAILHDEFLIWNAGHIRPEPVEIKLDMKAVEAAESDLREVTEMMKVDEEPESETEVETTPVRETAEADGPWQAFLASLDDNEKEYLRLCIAGSDTSAFLKGVKITRVKMDDAVNTKALDTVGDTVVEDGEPVEDYIEEIKKGL